jgi:hypothetical protein
MEIDNKNELDKNIRNIDWLEAEFNMLEEQ